jgi:lipopolysaccharide/colanic/teichoic acid biosynthesis glycosyltransferase
MIYHKFIKSIIDFTLAVIGLRIFSPLILSITIILFIQLKRFPIFKQKRALSLNHKPIYIYKFQTLESTSFNLHYDKNHILNHNYLKNKITPIGKFLRKTGLDELPQLFNIIKGEMSFIGPRPLTISDLDNMQMYHLNLYLKRTKLKSKPGISGIWQLYKNSSFDVPTLIFYDLLYENSKSIYVDLYLIIKTLSVTTRAKHKDALSCNDKDNKLLKLEISSQSFQY